LLLIFKRSIKKHIFGGGEGKVTTFSYGLTTLEIDHRGKFGKYTLKKLELEMVLNLKNTSKLQELKVPISKEMLPKTT